MEPTPVTIPAADTWPQWAKRQLVKHKWKLATLAASFLLAKLCGVLAEPIATLCRGLVAITDTLVGG